MFFHQNLSLTKLPVTFEFVSFFYRKPIRYLISPFKTGTSIVRFSVDGKYLISVSEADADGEQSIDFWHWTSNSEKPTCTLEHFLLKP